MDRGGGTARKNGQGRGGGTGLSRNPHRADRSANDRL